MPWSAPLQTAWPHHKQNGSQLDQRGQNRSRAEGGRVDLHKFRWSTPTGNGPDAPGLLPGYYGCLRRRPSSFGSADWYTHRVIGDWRWREMQNEALHLFYRVQI